MSTAAAEESLIRSSDLEAVKAALRQAEEEASMLTQLARQVGQGPGCCFCLSHSILLLRLGALCSNQFYYLETWLMSMLAS